MWKLQLFCDTCKHACVESTALGSRDVLTQVKQTARQLGWMYVQHVGWSCVRCLSKPRADLGEFAFYTGNLVTSDNVGLKGMRVRITNRMDDTFTLHALFEDLRAGRYAQRPHWFFQHEFTPEVPDAKNGSDSSREGIGATREASPGTGQP